jgi:hypothetical protein
MNEREREHAPYHDRRLEQQTLDALLRIEELLTAFLVLLPVQEVAPLDAPTTARIDAEYQQQLKAPGKGKRK